MSKQDTPTQSEKFKALAKQLECDESEAAFEKAVKRVAKKTPKQQ
ncbi:hypothetical protein sos41_21720 [Alphaproteobacteria bacterium SO-S41]|nr:hypothetical protein sos41_21720 [Alphaproteobacteria bacterium SO-S41]